MTSNTIFTAAVAGLAIVAPAQAQRPDRADREQRAERPQRQEQQKARVERPERQERQQSRVERPERQERQQSRVERPQRQERQPPRAERAERPQRQERQQSRVERPQRQERQQARAERPQRQERARIERTKREEQVRQERPQRQERASLQRAQREERVRFDRPRGEQGVRAERVQRERRDRSENAERVRTDRVKREQRAQRLRPDRDRRVQTEQAQAKRFGRGELRSAERLTRQEVQTQRLNGVRDRQALSLERQVGREARNDGQQQRQTYRPIEPRYSVGTRYAAAESVSRDWYDNIAAQRYQAMTGSAADYYYDYDYDDGYLYQIRRGNDLVSAAYPVLGGAFGVGQVLPLGYDSYNVPYGYRSLYYDTPDYSYRYGDGAIYRVDPDTHLVSAVVALLSAQRFGVGQMLPMGFDAYNVPYAYRDEYFDRSDAWYRYDDGYIYEVDPYSRRIVGMVPLSYGAYSVGFPAPAYASFGGYGGYAGYPSHQVPYAYDSLYYDAPGYDYHLAGGGIYQVDPITQLVSALVGLVTVGNFSVGQPLPVGYDTYNVPSEYRASYYDRPDAWYRYDDGQIYEIDPHSRIIQSAIPLSHGGYIIGQPIPAGYPAYPVPDYYQGLYYASPDYDYRYYDGGIYQIDRDSQIVSALAALVTGDTFSVGSMLPVGYDAYNLPYAYRSRYQDGDDNLYRYSDGRIYQIDAETRLIRSITDAVA